MWSVFESIRKKPPELNKRVRNMSKLTYPMVLEYRPRIDFG